MLVQIDFATCHLNRTTDGKHEHYLLTSLVVSRESRGNGEGSRLLEVCKSIAKRDGLNVRLWVGLGTPEFDQQALFEFYQRHGFEFFDVTRPTWLEWDHR